MSDERSLAEVIAAKKKAMTIDELAALLTISRGTLYAMAKTGSLPSMRLGTSVRLDPKTTAEWLRARTA